MNFHKESKSNFCVNLIFVYVEGGGGVGEWAPTEK